MSDPMSNPTSEPRLDEQAKDVLSHLSHEDHGDVLVFPDGQQNGGRARIGRDLFACIVRLAALPVPPVASNCDGCAQGLPIKDGQHYRDGLPWIGCTASRYAAPVARSGEVVACAVCKQTDRPITPLCDVCRAVAWTDSQINDALTAFYHADVSEYEDEEGYDRDVEGADRARMRAALAVLYTSRVALWTCPDCGFSFDAAHTNEPNGGYSCPVCELAALRATVPVPSGEAVAWLVEDTRKHEWLIALRSEPNSFIDPSYNVAVPVKTSDANAAVRFSDKASADSVIKTLRLQGYFASEHVFLHAHTLSSDAPGGPSREAVQTALMDAIEKGFSSAEAQYTSDIPTEYIIIDYAGIVGKIMESLYTITAPQEQAIGEGNWGTNTPFKREFVEAGVRGGKTEAMRIAGVKAEMKKSCSQCGQPFTARACGPTHAVIAAELANAVSPAPSGAPTSGPSREEVAAAIRSYVEARDVACGGPNPPSEAEAQECNEAYHALLALLTAPAGPPELTRGAIIAGIEAEEAARAEGTSVTEIVRSLLAEEITERKAVEMLTAKTATARNANADTVDGVVLAIADALGEAEIGEKLGAEGPDGPAWSQDERARLIFQARDLIAPLTATPATFAIARSLLDALRPAAPAGETKAGEAE